MFKNYDGVFGAFFKAFGADWNCMLKSPTVECSVKTVQSMQIKCKTSGLYSQTQVLNFPIFEIRKKSFRTWKLLNEFLTVKCWIVAVMNVTLMDSAQRGIKIFLSGIFSSHFLFFSIIFNSVLRYGKCGCECRRGFIGDGFSCQKLIGGALGEKNKKPKPYQL